MSSEGQGVYVITNLTPPAHPASQLINCSILHLIVTKTALQAGEESSLQNTFDLSQGCSDFTYIFGVVEVEAGGLGTSEKHMEVCHSWRLDIYLCSVHIHTHKKNPKTLL